MKLKALTLAAALAAATAVPAHALDWQDVWNGIGQADYTGGSHFATTASIWLSYDADNCDATLCAIRLIIMNKGTDGEVYKSVGLINLPILSTVDGDVSHYTGNYANNPSGWSPPPPNDLNGDGLPPDQWGWVAPNPAPSNGLQNGQSGTFYFLVGGLLTTEDRDVLGVGVHGVSGPNGCSTKLGVVAGQVIDNALDDPACTTTTVPEPITMVLMGTGLAGIAAARRRRGLELVDENGQDIEI